MDYDELEEILLFSAFQFPYVALDLFKFGLQPLNEHLHWLDCW